MSIGLSVCLYVCLLLALLHYVPKPAVGVQASVGLRHIRFMISFDTSQVLNYVITELSN